MKKNINLTNIDTKPDLKKLLAEHIGVEPEDIHEEDYFGDDLHMSPTDLTDFVQSLEEKGIDTGNIDLTTVETLRDLIDSLSSEVLIT